VAKSSIVTRTGDDGTTALLYGQRVSKAHPQIEAVGVCDELNVALGAIKPLLETNDRGKEVRRLIETVQGNLVALMGEIACAEADRERYTTSSFAKVTTDDVARLDRAAAELEARGLKFDGWATPGANALASAIEVARTTARRAERRLCALPSQGRTLRPEAGQFVNRLSDLLWLLAREAEQ
jgi:cob(I)alamin adenosyltransferase